MKLSPRAREVLARMVEHADDGDEEGELTFSSGQWWLGDDRTSGAVAKQLLKGCLIRMSHGDLGDKYQLYVATDEARSVLDDPNYVTVIERAIAEQNEKRP